MRFRRMRQAMAEAGVSAFLVRDTSNITWLTGFDGVFDEEQAHALLVTPDAALLHTDSRYSAACRAAAEEGPVIVDDMAASHANWLAGQPELGSKLGIEDTISLREHGELEQAFGDVLAPAGTLSLTPTRDVVVKLRAVKDAVEIERLQAAQAVTDAAFTYIVGFMRPGMTERQVQVELDDWMRRHGADSLAFPSIVATGPNAASPHAQPGDAVLEAGQCVTMDFGARVAGYCSDMTRVVFLGEPSARLKAAYSGLRDANEAVEALLKPGITGAEAHQRAVDVLADAGFPNAFGHGLGHGVGIDIHELPVLSPRNPHPLEAGNVVTVEPGIYVEGEFGMRLEDCGIITPTGFDPFTRSTHDLIVI